MTPDEVIDAIVRIVSYWMLDQKIDPTDSMPGLTRMKLDGKEYLIGVIHILGKKENIFNVGLALDDPATYDEALVKSPYLYTFISVSDGDPDIKQFREETIPNLYLPSLTREHLDKIRDKYRPLYAKGRATIERFFHEKEPRTAEEILDSIMLGLIETRDTKVEANMLPGFARFHLDGIEYIMGVMFRPHGRSDRFSSIGMALDDPAAIDEALKTLPYYSRDMGTPVKEKALTLFREEILPNLRLPHYSPERLTELDAVSRDSRSQSTI